MSERMEFRDWSTDAVEKLQTQEAEIQELRALTEGVTEKNWDALRALFYDEILAPNEQDALEAVLTLRPDQGSDQ